MLQQSGLFVIESSPVRRIVVESGRNVEWSTVLKMVLINFILRSFSILANSIILTLASLSLNQGEHDVKEDTEFFTQLSDTLDAIKKLPRFYGKVKYKTSNVTKVITSLRVTEGWAYIDYENPLIPL
uniref:Uncharacterized protein n=1 Tax=Rhizophagus irregularis (strain DAOM 181602 / DAOM 197198 / MUCL 43194) TaxID=747089 RepID=U9TGV6_RHIID